MSMALMQSRSNLAFASRRVRPGPPWPRGLETDLVQEVVELNDGPSDQPHERADQLLKLGRCRATAAERSVRAERLKPFGGSVTSFAQEVGRKRRNVLTPPAKGRHFDDGLRETLIEVSAELAIGHRGFDHRIEERDDADVELDECPFLSDHGFAIAKAGQSSCTRAGVSARFVSRSVPPVAWTTAPPRPTRSTTGGFPSGCRRSAARPKSRRSSSCGEPSAQSSDERSLFLAFGSAMDRPRDERASAPRLAGNEDAAPNVSGGANQLRHGLHGSRLGEERFDDVSEAAAVSATDRSRALASTTRTSRSSNGQGSKSIWRPQELRRPRADWPDR